MSFLGRKKKKRNPRWAYVQPRAICVIRSKCRHYKTTRSGSYTGKFLTGNIRDWLPISSLLHAQDVEILHNFRRASSAEKSSRFFSSLVKNICKIWIWEVTICKTLETSKSPVLYRGEIRQFNLAPSVEVRYRQLRETFIVSIYVMLWDRECRDLPCSSQAFPSQVHDQKYLQPIFHPSYYISSHHEVNIKIFMEILPKTCMPTIENIEPNNSISTTMAQIK